MPLFKVLTKGWGKVSPTKSQQVEVHYAGSLIDGTEFDSSYKRGQPASFGVSQVIPGRHPLHSSLLFLSSFPVSFIFLLPFFSPSLPNRVD